MSSRTMKPLTSSSSRNIIHKSYDVNSKKNKTNQEKVLTPLDKKLEMIKTELEIMKPDTLLLNSDPSLDATSIIEQIQSYHNMINKEMVHLKHQENQEKELVVQIKKKQEHYEELIKPKHINYIEKPETSSEKRKPIIDYRVKINSLEKEIVLICQHYNDTKSKNEKMMNELNEMRKKFMTNSSKLEELSKEFKETEDSFKSQKEYIEKNLKNKEEEDLMKQIYKDQKHLFGKNDQMIQKIIETDKDMTEKLAKKKYYEHEKEKLIEKEQKIIQKWKKEMKDFYQKNAEAIKNYKSFDSSSKVLEIINEDKIKKLEEILENIYSLTNLSDINALVNYFTNCQKENKNFEDFTYALTSKVTELEKEVEELEYIINFCEQNLEIKTEVNFDEDDNKQLELIKTNAENFIHLQYNLIVDYYKNFTEKIISKVGELNKTEIMDHKEKGKIFILKYIYRFSGICYY